MHKYNQKEQAPKHQQQLYPADGEPEVEIKNTYGARKAKKPSESS